ncbi:hypothetical protein A0128_20180 [Leptospira tipperaryensis]|uniref:CopG family transcriptional regulator n=1 Tax=Leptospira tipperaryensis TaxID=2564040 RepID=A0A1D7V3F7_9LEPT|nr:hypothetical protein [Leptospira tipperaryensis]AOP36339.1 hypothetical protein A0128_20180 [Leptospira tipperaryensis]
MIKKKIKRNEVRRAGQPRIDPDAPLERRSVGLPEFWWKEIDHLANEYEIKASAIVRLAVGLHLRRLGKIKTKIGLQKTRKTD